MVVMFANRSERKEQSLQMTFYKRFLPSFGLFGQSVAEEKIFYKSTNQKQELPVAAMFVNGSRQNEQSLQRTFRRCSLPCFCSFGQVVLEETINIGKVNGRQTPSDGKSSHCLWKGELKIILTLRENQPLFLWAAL